MTITSVLQNPVFGKFLDLLCLLTYRLIENLPVSDVSDAVYMHPRPACHVSLSRCYGSLAGAAAVCGIGLSSSAAARCCQDRPAPLHMPASDAVTQRMPGCSLASSCGASGSTAVAARTTGAVRGRSTRRALPALRPVSTSRRVERRSMSSPT